MPILGQNFDPEQVPVAIEKELAILVKDTNYRHYFDTLKLYYAQKEYNPVWLERIKDEQFIRQINLLSDSIVYEGLNPEHYMVDSIKKYVQLTLESDSMHLSKDIYKYCAKVELYVSNCLLGLWHDRVMGRTNPKDVLGMKYTLPYPNHPGFALLSVLEQDSGIYHLVHYYPKHSDYWKLKGLLYEAYSVTEGSETMIDTTGIRKVKPGDTTGIVPLLAKRMVELGLAPDTLMSIYTNDSVYHKSLAKYIIEFQKMSNLTDDGIIGKSTLKILNASRNDKIDEIRANIERCRWLGIEPIKPYVRVNIPEFMLHVYTADQLAWSCNVVVGKTVHKTVIFSDNLKYIAFSPYWNVPQSIVKNELLKAMSKDRHYLQKNNMEITGYRDGLPEIRQKPGLLNSLGLVKFLFPNSFNIYLHDTPSKSLFNESERAFSHGCIRISEPFKLAQFLLRNDSSWDDKKITSAMHAGTERIVSLKEKTPVFIVYFTAFTDNEGRLNFRKDIYQRDGRLADMIMDSGI